MLLLNIILKVLSNFKKEQSKRLVVTKLNDYDWHGTLDGKLICEFNYLKDYQGYWINFMCTHEKYRDKGYGFGTKMINEAVKEYGKVLFCGIERLEFNTKKYQVNNYSVLTNKSDTRYPKDEVLMIFANKCIEKKIIKKEWVKSPFD